MNLVDFVVTKILEERKGKVYELYDMTEAEAGENPKIIKIWRSFSFPTESNRNMNITVMDVFL